MVRADLSHFDTVTSEVAKVAATPHTDIQVLTQRPSAHAASHSVLRPNPDTETVSDIICNAQPRARGSTAGQEATQS
jgi:hypothetical protein